MEIDVHWRKLRAIEDAGWQFARVLYAYADPSDGEILYIGKADGELARFALATRRRTRLNFFVS